MAWAGPSWAGLSDAEVDEFARTYATNSGPGITVTAVHASTVTAGSGAVTGIWIETTDGEDHVWDLVVPAPGAFLAISIYTDDPLIALPVAADHYFGMVRNT